MVYLMSGEYGRLWEKERDEWFKGVFVPAPKEVDMIKRKMKIRKEIKAAKLAAQVSINERKQRRAKEEEAKAKEKMEELERVKERVRKLAAPKLVTRSQKKKRQTKNEPRQPTEEKTDVCPKGWKPVELTLQCECSQHKEENMKEETKEQQQAPESQAQSSNQGCTMCPGFVKGMQKMHEANIEAKGPNEKEKEDDNKTKETQKIACGKEQSEVH